MYHAVVRRALAAVLLVLFSFSLIPSSAFASDPESRLPACCRRNGKHHCVIATEGSSASPALHAAPCLVFPGAKAIPASPMPGVVPARTASGFSPPVRSVDALANEALLPMLFRALPQQRGPPEFPLY
jgi:hypothetical protein